MSANPKVAEIILKSLIDSRKIDANGIEQRSRLAHDGFDAGQRGHLPTWFWCLEEGLVEFNDDLQMCTITPLGNEYHQYFANKMVQL